MISRSLIIIAIFAVASINSFAQSKTTDALSKKHTDALSLFFYQNTLRMINQSGDPAFDELIKDIEKMKFLMINKKDGKFSDYKKLVSDYKAEDFEEVMTSRFEGKNFDVFLKGTPKKTEGMLVLVNDENNLYVLDILGRINVNKITDFYSTFDKSADISQQIQRFTNRDGEHGQSRKEKTGNR